MGDKIMVSVNDGKIENKWKPQKLYKRRWLILSVFILHTINAGVQWVQYSIINSSVVRYYNVSVYMVDWTTECFMLAYVICIMPVLWLIDKLGLRRSLIVASGGVCLGAVIKAFSVYPDGFYLLMIGQIFESVFQVFTFGLAIRITGVWFGAHEISLAGALSLFGDQLGTALAFIVPTLMVKDTSLTEIGNGLFNMNLSIAITSTIVVILVVVFVESEPPKPPSVARTLQIEVGDKDTLASFKKILSKRSFLLIFFSYGLCMGTFNCFATVLSEIFKPYFQDSGTYAGRCGFLVSVSGLFGSLSGGYFLDKKRKYKETSICITLCCSICMLFFAYSITMDNVNIIYAIAIIQGFFWMMYYTSGVQMGIEVSYPISEVICGGLLALSIQGHSLLITTVCVYSIRNIGPFVSLVGMSAIVLISSVLVMMIPSNMKRQQAERTDIITKDDAIKTFL